MDGRISFLLVTVNTPSATETVLTMPLITGSQGATLSSVAVSSTTTANINLAVTGLTLTSLSCTSSVSAPTLSGTTATITGNVNASNLIASTWITTPALTCSGNLTTGNLTAGAGLYAVTSNVSGNADCANLNASAGIYGTVRTPSQPNITSVGTLTSLAVTGAVSAGSVSTTGLTGTLTVASAAQPNVTSLGTLTSLAVSGNVTAWNLSGTGITGTLSTAAQPNITSVGNLTSLAVSGTANLATANISNLVVDDLPVTMGRVLLRSFTRTLSTTVNNAVAICSLSALNKSGLHIRLIVSQAVASNHISKHYEIPITYNATSSQWRRLLPLSSTGANNSSDWAVDMQVTGSDVITLRLVRTASGGSASSSALTASLYVNQQAASSVTITDDSTTSTSVTNSGLFSGTMLTQIPGVVGVGTESPSTSYALDVAGNINCSGYAYSTRPSFRITRSGGWTVSSGEAVFKGGTTVFEKTPSGSSGYSSTNGTYTVPIAGVWCLTTYIRTADTTSQLGMRPATGAGNTIPNSDGTFWVPSDGSGVGRRVMVYTDTMSITASTQYSVFASQAGTIQDFVFSGYWLGSA